MDILVDAMLAGIMIALGCLVKISVGGVAGAVLFGTGLLTILAFNFWLFTGKAGLVWNGTVKWWQLLLTWIGNFVGTGVVGCSVSLLSGKSQMLRQWVEGAAKVVMTRESTDWGVNLLLGILCGILMFVAVTGWKGTGKIEFVIMPVSLFLLTGLAHCVADMGYFWLSMAARDWWQGLVPLLVVSVGNFIGCSLIPVCRLGRQEK